MLQKTSNPKIPRQGTSNGQATEAARTRRFAGSSRIKRSYALLWRQTMWGIGSAICAFLLGRCSLLFGAQPLGIALLCAATHRIPYLYGGVMLSALTAEGGRLALCCTYTAALLIRILSRSVIELPGAGHPPRTAIEAKPSGENEEEAIPSPSAQNTPLALLRDLYRRASALLSHWFSESIYLRMMSACVSAFIISLYRIIAGGFLYYDLFGALFAMVTAPVAAFLYAGLYDVGRRGRDKAAREDKAWATSYREIRRIAGAAAIAFSMLYAMRDVSLLGISAAAFCGFGLTLGVSRRRGLLYGLLAGVICGLAYSPLVTPSFVLAALVFGLLQRFSVTVAALSASAAGLAWGLIPQGFEALTDLLPAFAAASLLLCAADRLLTHPAILLDLTPKSEYLEASEGYDIARRRMESAEGRMQELSETFSSLAGIFYSLSDRIRRPGLLDLRRMCDRAFDTVCPHCPQRELCWGADYVGTLTQLSRIAAALHEHGTANEETVEEKFRSRCPSITALIGQINAECARMTESALRTEKTEIFAMNYDGLSQILADALEEQNADFVYDEALSERVRRALPEMGLRAEGVLVWGTRQRHIVARGVDASASDLGAAQIHDRLEEVCGFALGEIYFDLSDTGVTMRVASRPRYTVRRAIRTMAAKGDICGDTANVFETDRNYTYALISDGMGTGQEAAFTSGLCSLFLEKMLLAGNHTDTAIRMLNSMIRQKGGGIDMECSATVDLLELDLLNGRAVVLKSGASPTYVRRDDCLFKLHAATAPIGILRAVDAQKITYEVKAGDVIMMISDGIGGGESAEGRSENEAEDCLWLLDMLSDGWQNDLNLMAESILTRAREEGSQDDLSVILIEVCET